MVIPLPKHTLYHSITCFVIQHLKSEFYKMLHLNSVENQRF